MVVLVAAVLLAAAGVTLAYRFSPAAKLKTRIQDALSPFQQLDSEIRGLQQTLKNETESLTNRHIQGIYALRLKAIPVDELKKYATGMRLQALKDVGVRTLADLQGWSEYRVSQVRGVGPKSASAIVHSVATVTADAKAVAIPHPIPPFSDDSERQLMQALYRQHWFEIHISDQATGFAATVTSHQCMRDAILAKATLACWLWKLGANATIRRCLEQGDALIGALADPSLRAMMEVLSQSLTAYRSICANPVTIESIIQDFNEVPSFYDAYLTNRFGALNNRVREKPLSQPESGKFPASDVVHVEFGRVVAGPPPKPTVAGPTNLDPSAARSKQSESLFSVSVGSTSGHAGTEFTLPIPLRSAGSSDLRWLKKGEAIQIQGHSLCYGFIYVGKGISDEQHYAVNPQLSAKAGDVASPDATGYYSSFSLLSPERRSLYLKWLADGALSPTDAGFGMLYFYGIERRLLDLLQTRVLDEPGVELEQLLQEVRRLADLFKDGPGSVTQCCLRLSDFAAACVLDRTSIPELPMEWVRTGELPFTVRYGIGWFMKDHRPIPVDWALRWAYVEPTIYLRTPATRCPEEFEASFATVYRKKFGDGLVVPANKTKLKLTYQPGWPMHFGKEIRHDFSGVPDVAAVAAPQRTLSTLVEEATSQIDSYSRYLGRNPAKSGTLEAYLNLPLPLWPSPATDRWRHFVASHVEPVQPLSLESLLLELDSSGEQGPAKLPEIAANLGRALVGFEPDILAGARRPKPSEMIVLFPLTSESTAERATTEYKRASLIVSLSACVALADGQASEDEAAAVEELIASWQHLQIDLRTRLRAQYRLQVQLGISLGNLRSRFGNLTPDGRMQLALSLCSLAAADGNIAAGEVKLLEQIYRALELEPKLLYTHLRPGTQRVPGLDSQTSSIPSEPSAYTVDTARLAALRRETDQVSALLDEVFAEEESPCSSQRDVASLVLPAEKSLDDALLPGLDSKHLRFLAELLRRASWTREELQSMAAHLQIMLDGALERINDAAFDLLGEPITEGDDPVYVQQNILEAAE
ncbi:MAG: TerB N-terminal domain-containing protein [Acidobacteriaceae bacterium]